MGIFNKLKCGIGIHDWMSWSSKTTGSCKQTRNCYNCSKTEQSESHTWKQWVFIQEKSCEQIRHCNHCSQKDQQKAHQWDAWKYAGPDTCVKICFCRRCDEKDTYYPLEYDHEYDKEFKRVNCYNHIYTCKRCRHQRFDYLKATLLIGDQGIHRFGDWYETKPGLFSRDCMDCSYSEEGHKLY